jgi:hypothetical protein
MNDHLVFEGGIAPDAAQTDLQVRQVIPGGYQDGKLRMIDRCFESVRDHAGISISGQI